MKLMFSEADPYYENYIFPYAIWAAPESDEPFSKLYNLGFLPSRPSPPIFYLARSVRVLLSRFKQTSEDRRMLHKFSEATIEIIPKDEFIITEQVLSLCNQWAIARHLSDVMIEARVQSIFSSLYTTHIICFRLGSQMIGISTAFIEQPILVHLMYSFYDVENHPQNLGKFMMTAAINHFASFGLCYVYLGTCYSKGSVYKTCYEGIEFFNGVRWTNNKDELNFLIAKFETNNKEHLLEADEYINLFYDGDFNRLIDQSSIHIDLS